MPHNSQTQGTLADREFGKYGLRTLTASMLSDRRSLRRLIGIVSETAARYDNAIQVLTFLPNSDVEVLIDFDVIHAYITPEKLYDDEEQMQNEAQIAHFFERSKVPYSLADGAVRDLRQFLKVYRPFVALPDESQCEACLAAIKEATSAEVAGSEAIRQYEVWKQALNDANPQECVQDRVLLHRLHSVLHSPRFRGVVHTYSTKTAVAFAKSLDDLFQAQKRKTYAKKGKPLPNSSSGRKMRQVEINDGINLATACHLNCDQKTVHYLVLTNRLDVYNVAKNYVNAIENDCEYRFALLPSEMFWLDITGFSEWKHPVRATAEVCRKTLNQLAEALRLHLDNVTNGDAQLIPDTLRNAMNSWSSEVSAFSLLSIEEQMSEVSADLTDVSFFKILLNIKKIALTVPIVAYVSRSSHQSGFSCYTICDDAPGRTGYLCTFTVSADGCWSVTFNAHGTYFDFVSAFRHLMSRKTKKSGSPVIAKVTTGGPNAVFEDQGVRVCTSYGTIFYHCDGELTEIPQSLDTIERLSQEAIRYLTHSRDTVSAVTKERALISPRILSISVISDPYEIDFDLQPKEHASRKYGVVRGRGQLPESLASFIQVLGATLLSEESLQEILDEKIETGITTVEGSANG